MGMGIVTDADFLKELENLKSNKKPEIKELPTPGRKEGDLNVPPELRKLIASTALTESSKEANELARGLGISSSSVSAYKNGATSTTTYDKPNADLKEHVDEIKIDISKKARARLLKAIEEITDDKLSVTKPRELAGIAKDMASVVEKMEPKDDKPIVNSPTFIVYHPHVREEKHYDTITLKE